VEQLVLVLLVTMNPEMIYVLIAIILVSHVKVRIQEIVLHALQITKDIWAMENVYVTLGFMTRSGPSRVVFVIIPV
jgi:hypothetical protein